MDPADATAMARAHALVKVRQKLLAELSHIRTQAVAVQTQRQAADTFFSEKLAFEGDPSRLAGLAALYQRHPSRRIAMTNRYRWFLEKMIEPLPSIDGLRVRPLRVDFNALAPAARPYLLGPFLDIHPGNRYPELCLARSEPQRGKLVIVQTGGPVDRDLWRARLPAINTWLQGHWTLAAHDASSLTFTRRDPLPPQIPFHKGMLKRGALFAGIDTDSHRLVHIPFADLSSGTYICGTSGSGKTSALHVLLRSIFANLDLFAAVHLVDGKDGVAFNRYANLHPKIEVHFDEPDVWRLIADLNALMRERNAEQRTAGIDKATQDFVAVIIDELPTFVTSPTTEGKKEHAAFLDNLNRIAMRGRSAGIRMVLITQTPVKEQIPVTLRANCATTLAFRLPEQTHATALFGTLSPDNDPRKLPTGQARLLQAETGKLVTVQIPFAPLWNPRRTS